jgi:hypothetical protein
VFDGGVTICEIEECIWRVENAWRAVWCEESFGLLYCDPAFEDCECPGAMDCDEIE